MHDNSMKYAVKQAVTSGAPTLVIMLVLNIFLNKADMNFEAIVADIPITVLITGLVCTIIQVFIVKGSVKRGAMPEITPVGKQAAYVLIPKNTAVFVIMISILAALLFACTPIGLLQIFAPDAEVKRMIYIIVKALIVSFAAAYVTFHANIFLGAVYQERCN